MRERGRVGRGEVALGRPGDRMPRDGRAEPGPLERALDGVGAIAFAKQIQRGATGSCDRDLIEGPQELCFGPFVMHGTNHWWEPLDMFAMNRRKVAANKQRAVVVGRRHCELLEAS